MSEPTQKPVIFLAFAQDRVEGSAYLHNLPVEKRRISEALEKAEQADLCEVVDRSNTTVEEIFDIFQKQKYKDRIAIFHYGGHAGDYALLLETPAGEHAIAHSEGLDSFLAKQKGLQLIFINGCCSQKQAQDLIKAGVPAVIGTSQKINDEVATDLSVQFYNALAEGRSIDRAWAEAVDLVKTKKGTTSYRDLGGEDEMEETEDRFPWDIYYRKGAEIVKDWNLPEAVANPLFGLPEIPKTYNLPETPFLFLKRYERTHAEIFFGRSYHIRALYNRISDSKSDPIILLYGQSGVGKSSLFDAGLNPRLEEEYTVIYVRRIQEKGLVGTLAFALQQKLAKLGAAAAAPPPVPVAPLPEPAAAADQATRRQAILQLQAAAQNLDEQTVRQEIEALINRLQRLPPENNTTSVVAPPAAASSTAAAAIGAPHDDDALFILRAQWLQLEARIGKPLLVIIDQVEELYTRPNPQQPEELEVFLVALQSTFGSPIDQPKGKLLLGYRKEYHPEIEEACKLFRLPRATVFLESLRRKDILDIFHGLTRTPALKARYNLSVEETLPEIIADDLVEDKDSPVAPVLQILLTKMWNAALKENSTTPRFTVAQYQQLKKEGLAMAEFFEQQMQKLRVWQQEVVDSGLALDVLHFHTTALGTAGNCTLEKLRETYQNRQEIIDALVAKCKEFYLLTEAQHNQETTSLTHDTLAPVVINQYHHSDRPGQRAARVLGNKIEGFLVNEKEVWLDEADLVAVETGKSGMRRLVVAEEKLLQISRQRKMEREKERRRNRRLRKILVTAIFFFGIFAGWQWWLSDQNFKKSKANNLAFIAKETLKTDRTKALRVAEAAYAILENDPPVAAQQILSEAFHTLHDTTAFYAANLQHADEVTAAVFSPRKDRILTAARDSTAVLWDLQGNPLNTLKHSEAVNWADFSPSGERIITATIDGAVWLWDSAGTPLDTINHAEEIYAAVFSPNEKFILTACKDDTARLWDLQGNPRATFSHQDEVFGAVFAPDGQKILTASADDMAKLWDLQGHLLAALPHGKSVNDAVFAPDGQKVLTASRDNTAKLWDLQGKLLATFAHKSEVFSAVFAPDGEKILTASADRTAKLWNLRGELIATFDKHHEVTRAVFFPDGRKILAASKDRTATLWNLRGELIANFAHTNEVTRVAFSSDEAYILTASKDSTAKLWDVRELRLQHINKHANWAAFSPNGERFLTLSDDDVARLWDLRGSLIDSLTLAHQITAAFFSPLEERVLILAEDHIARLWNLQGRSIDSLVHNHAIRSADFSLNGQQIITVDIDDNARLWDLPSNASAQPISKTLGQTGVTKSAVFSSDGRKILTAATDGFARIWDSKGILIDSLYHGGVEVSLALFSPQGKQIITAAMDGFTRVWNDKGRLIDSLNTGEVSQLIISPDEKRIVTILSDGAAALWDWQEKRSIPLEHDNEIRFAVFSPDGKQILTAAIDGIAKLWNLQSEWLAKLDKHHHQEIKTAVFSPNGRNILTAALDNTVKLWWTPQAIYDWLKQANISRLTEKEKAEYGIKDEN